MCNSITVSRKRSCHRQRREHCHPDILQRRDTATLTLGTEGPAQGEVTPWAVPRTLGRMREGKGANISFLRMEREKSR